MGFEIPVEFEALGDEDSNVYGKWQGHKQRICLDPSYSKQVQAQTFWHEYVHCALDNLGYKKLNDNEQFVDQFAHCLYQLEKTRKNK